MDKLQLLLGIKGNWFSWRSGPRSARLSGRYNFCGCHQGWAHDLVADAAPFTRQTHFFLSKAGAMPFGVAPIEEDVREFVEISFPPAYCGEELRLLTGRRAESAAETKGTWIICGWQSPPPASGRHPIIICIPHIHSESLLRSRNRRFHLTQNSRRGP